MNDETEQLEEPASQKPRVEPIWGVTANVMTERPYGPGGAETRRGTKKFSGGAKVYVAGVFWGVAGENITVIGRFRGRHGYITSTMQTKHLENFHAELIYSPAVISRILRENGGVPNDGSEVSKLEAEKLADMLRNLEHQRKTAQRDASPGGSVSSE